VTFDEWWKEAGPKGQWVGDYETDAESNARIGWEAALSHKCQRCDYPNCFCKVAAPQASASTGAKHGR
jgi:hypothetical protein